MRLDTQTGPQYSTVSPIVYTRMTRLKQLYLYVRENNNGNLCKLAIVKWEWNKEDGLCCFNFGELVVDLNVLGTNC